MPVALRWTADDAQTWQSADPDVLAPQAGLPPGLALDPAAHAGGLGFEDVLTVRTGHRIETLGIGGHGGGSLSRPAPSGCTHLWGEARTILWMLPTSQRVAPPPPPPPTAGLFGLGADPPFFPIQAASRP